MPTISVSPAVPDKLVVNGCDLLDANREELSASQNRELQRYIDAHAHLLGFLDKEKDGGEADAEVAERGRFMAPAAPGNISSAMSGKFASGAAPPPPEDIIPPPRALSASMYASAPARAPSAASAPVQRAGSPYSLGGGSEYGGGKRKGVSWSDVATSRRRSNSPPDDAYFGGGALSSSDYSTTTPMGDYEYARPLDYDEYSRRSRASTRPTAQMNGHGPLGGDRQDYNRYRGAAPTEAQQHQFDRGQNPFDRSAWSNPWAGASLDHRTRQGGSGSPEGRRGFSGFAKPDLPTYSALRRGPDDFNPFLTHEQREEIKGLRKSWDRDDVIKFHSYGDHRVSGIEIKPKGWTGGEIVTDPNIMNKSLKPRRIYYSPIGDGVVAADGIEMKRPPPDLTPKRYVYHQRYVEQDPGKPGVRVTEDVWHEGDLGDGDLAARSMGPVESPDDGGRGRGRGPRRAGPGDDDGVGRGGPEPAWPGLGDNGGGRKRGPPPGPDADDGGRGPGGPGKFPTLEGLEGPGADRGARGPSARDEGPRPDSGMSAALSGPPGDRVPREGWTIEFITNPRELINQFGTETLTSIFDTDDHTPKLYTQVKETWSPAPPEETRGAEREEEVM